MEHVLRAAANSRMRSEMATDRPWYSQRRQPDGLHYDGEEEGTKEGGARNKGNRSKRVHYDATMLQILITQMILAVYENKN